VTELGFWPVAVVGQGGTKLSVSVASAVRHSEALQVTMIELGGDTQRLQKTLSGQPTRRNASSKPAVQACR